MNKKLTKTTKNQKFTSPTTSLKHLTGAGHPESPKRWEIIHSTLDAAGLLTPERLLSPRMAAREEILFCHTPEYYALVEREISALKDKTDLSGNRTLSTGDAQISPGSWEAALMAAGSVIAAVDAIMSGKASTVFCNVRPPGHHACRAAGMGFCLFNNAAIGARYAQKRYGLGKILIADWDVHHGNGTQDIFYDDPSVFYFSTHQLGLYPGTGFEEEKGRGKGLGTTLNCPILGGAQSAKEVRKAFDVDLRREAKAFKPEMILISAGFDAHRDDPLGGFNLTEEDFVELTRIVKEIAHESDCKGIISILEGGYNLTALARSVYAHVIELGK